MRRADVEDMEVMLVRTRLRWLGYVCRMNNDRPVKQLLYCELAHGSRPIGLPKLRFKDTCKSALKCGHVLDQWLSTVNNRDEWKRLTRVVCDAYSSRRVQDYEKRRTRRIDEQRKQCGFRKNHSTQDAVTYFTDCIRKGIDDGCITAAVFINFRKAFDSVNHQFLKKKLPRFGIQNQELNGL